MLLLFDRNYLCRQQMCHYMPGISAAAYARLTDRMACITKTNHTAFLQIILQLT